jgi:hypothetical protein
VWRSPRLPHKVVFCFFGSKTPPTRIRTAFSGAPAQNTRIPEYHISQNGIVGFFAQKRNLRLCTGDCPAPMGVAGNWLRFAQQASGWNGGIMEYWNGAASDPNRQSSIINHRSKGCRLPATALFTAEDTEGRRGKRAGTGPARRRRDAEDRRVEGSRPEPAGGRGERSFARNPSRISRKKREKTKKGWPGERRGGQRTEATEMRKPQIDADENGPAFGRNQDLLSPSRQARKEIRPRLADLPWRSLRLCERHNAFCARDLRRPSKIIWKCFFSPWQLGTQIKACRTMSYVDFLV